MGKFNDKVMYFVGVSTEKSIINAIFPKWMEILGCNVQLQGVNIPINASPHIYRECAKKISDSENVLGALVTSHKVAIYKYANDIFDVITDSAREFREVGAIYKTEAGMNGEATDIISVHNAFDNIFKKVNITDSDICILGCGGAGLALGYIILKYYNNSFKKIIMTDTNVDRLEVVKQVLSVYDADNKLSFIPINRIDDNDDVINKLNKESYIVNATGVGKDLPGSPISCDIQIPFGSCLWEYNYRGDLMFMNIAQKQSKEKKLTLYNGFEYFIYGWTTVISRVLNIDISNDIFNSMKKIAMEYMN